MPTDANDSMNSARSDSRGEQSWMSRALMKSRTIVASRQVSDRMAQDLITRLLLLEQDDGQAPITVYINSPGGSADSGFAIYDAMKMVSCPIRTVVVGLCASAGVILFMGGDQGQKYATPYSRFLLHQPSTGIVGPASDLEITAREILRIREIYAEIIQKEMGVDKEKLLADANRDFWLGAQDAKKYGLVDRIIASRSELP